MSSSGALLTLAARGPQDVYLTGNPDTSYFRQIYKRHTNFTFTEVRQVMEGSVAVGSMTEINISRQGDLLSYIYLYAKGHGAGNLIDDIDRIVLRIGGQEIVTMSSTDIRLVVDQMSARQSLTSRDSVIDIAPIPLWFGNNWNSCLPMCALQYHDVKIQVHWAADPGVSVECFANMVFLDNQERSMFTQAPELNYIITQHQRSEPFQGLNRVTLNFNNNVKALYVYDITTGSFDSNFKLMVNSVQLLESTWQRAIHRQCYHQNVGYTTTTAMIPFCLDIGSDQPTGSINFSRLDNVELVLDTAISMTSGDKRVHAASLNILKIKDGMGGLEFQN